MVRARRRLIIMFARSPIIREIEVKSIFPNPICRVRISVNPYVGCTARLQILLCLLYEALYRSCRAVGNFFRRKWYGRKLKILKNMPEKNYL